MIVFCDAADWWNGQLVSRPPYAAMYWSPAQMLAHERVNGASTRTGDVFASGTISGPEKEQRGAFIELTWGGTDPVEVNGELRTFLEDGDEIVLPATAPAAGNRRLGFGEARGRIIANPLANGSGPGRARVRLLARGEPAIRHPQHGA